MVIMIAVLQIGIVLSQVLAAVHTPGHRYPRLLPLLCSDDVLYLPHQCLHVDEKQGCWEEREGERVKEGRS